MPPPPKLVVDCEFPPERMDGLRLLCVKLEPGVGVDVRDAPTAMAGCGPEDVADPD